MLSNFFISYIMNEKQQLEEIASEYEFVYWSCVVQLEGMYKKTHAAIREDPAAKKGPERKEGKVKRYVHWSRV